MAVLSQRQRAALAEMGIDVWVSRNPPADLETAPDISVNDIPVAEVPAGDVPDDWAALNATIRNCTRCALHETRTQAVCGVGNTAAEWLVVGEAPGADEDRQGEPFVGRAGQLLNEMLRAAGHPREQVYIANVLKCRPPNNRDPQADEVEACIGYLHAQIERLQPKLILVVGRIAAQTLLNVDTPIGKLRGRVHRFGDAGTPLVVTYHPAYLLRSPAQKRKSWEDLKLAMAVQ